MKIMSTKGTSGNSMDAKREEFRKYLEKEGVLEYLTKQLVRLYEEADKPSNALDYLKNNFSGKDTEVAQLKAENLEKENLQLKDKIKVLESEKAELELKVKELQVATANGDSPSLASAQSPAKSPKEIAGKTESDEDEPMEASEDKSSTKSPSKSTGEAAPLSPPRSKFDQPRSPTSLQNKEEEVEDTTKTDDATNEKMDSDDSKAKTEGEDSSITSGDKSAEEGNPDADKKPSE